MEGEGYTGHTGIVVKKGDDYMLASASSKTGTVNLTTNGINGNKAAEGFTVRRYSGPKSHYSPETGSHISRKIEK